MRNETSYQLLIDVSQPECCARAHRNRGVPGKTFTRRARAQPRAERA